MSTGAPTNGHDNDEEQRPNENGSPQRHNVPELPDIADLPTARMAAAELQSAVDDSRRAEASRHRGLAKVLRDQAAALDGELLRAGEIIEELEKRLAALEVVPREQRSAEQLGEMTLLYKLLPDHLSLRAHLRSDQGAFRAQALEHERASKWLLRETG